MARTSYFFYEFSNDFSKYMTPDEAWAYAKSNKCDITRDGLAKFRGAKRHTVKDGFKAGYNPALGEYVGGRREYERKLTEKGLVEIGNAKPSAEKEKTTKYFDYDTRKSLKQETGMSDCALDSLKD